MARICPQCSQIHFETSTEAMPTQCRKCEADLNGFSSSAASLDDAVASKSEPSAPQTGKLQFLIGFALLAACGGSIWYGLKLHNEAVEATALVVKYSKSMSAPPGTNRADNIAFFTINGKRTYTYPGVRADGDSFKVYYPPGQPEAASESRPFILFVVAGFCGLVGATMTFLGLFRFFLSRAQFKDFNRAIRVS